MWPFDIPRQRREAKIIDTLQKHGELSSYELSKRAEIFAGSLYPTLMRMEKDGRLVSRWGVATAERGGHRPRLYRLA
jgi:DNA-binding PadR family transcriptional regulator